MRGRVRRRHRDAPFVRLADEAHALSRSTAAETYLDQGKLLAVAARAGADAVHPGYGFLAENAEFAQAVIDAGLTWIGPPPQAIRDLGDKVTARQIAAAVGAPQVAGSKGPVHSSDEVLASAAEHGLPVAIKAVYGGGGRGLKVARTAEETPELFDSAVREAQAAFGRGDCFVERYLERPRHVEAQVLADEHGSVVVVGTRDCSLQRRHQKLVEEAPAPFLTDAQRTEIHTSARAICAEAGYRGAGTVEFLVGQDGVISFLEVNTRLQVEHPVSEETTGLDLVGEQFRIAAGEPLGYTADPEPVGHSIEFRINGTRGSFQGLRALARDAADGAAIHLRHRDGTYNAPFARALLHEHDPHLLHLWRREQGLLVPAGNPRGVRGPADLAALLVARRETGAGTRVLLDQLLLADGIGPQTVTGPELHSHLEIALAVASGIADVGLGLRVAVTELGLDFLPLTWEHYDIALGGAALGAVQPLLTALREPTVIDAIGRLGGYDLAHAGHTQRIAT